MSVSAAFSSGCTFSFALSDQQAHGVCISETVDFHLFVRPILLKLLQNSQSWRDVGLTLLVLPNEPGEGDSELFTDQRLELVRELTVGNPVSEEVEISFILFEFLSDEVKFIGELIIFLRDLKEILSAYGFNDADGFSDKLLQLLSIVTDEAVCAETGALIQNVKVKLCFLGPLHFLGNLIRHNNVDFAVSEQHEFVRF
jgi:hypothetical protein